MGFSQGNPRCSVCCLKKKKSFNLSEQHPRHLELSRGKPTAPGRHLDNTWTILTYLSLCSLCFVPTAHGHHEGRRGQFPTANGRRKRNSGHICDKEALARKLVCGQGRRAQARASGAARLSTRTSRQPSARRCKCNPHGAILNFRLGPPPPNIQC